MNALCEISIGNQWWGSLAKSHNLAIGKAEDRAGGVVQPDSGGSGGGDDRVGGAADDGGHSGIVETVDSAVGPLEG